MPVIAKQDGEVTGVIVMEVEPDQQQQVLAANREEADEKIARLPGFESSSLHTSLDGTRIANVLQWRSLEQFEAAFDAFEKVPTTNGSTVEFNPAEVVYIDRAGPEVGSGEIPVSSADGLLTIIIKFDLEATNQKPLLELLERNHERALRNLPGFVSVAFMRGLADDSILEYLQWESKESFEALWGNEDRRKHVEEVLKLVTHMQLHTYSLASVREA